MKEPTLEEIKRIITFGRNADGELFVERVRGNVRSVLGDVWIVVGDVKHVLKRKP